ncbi:glycosyltransferase [Rhizobiaceae bacterium]|nr:glycosyltransferase [Rhizobiaceae bacterium]
MLVHNGVRRDARVIKEARTLSEAGHRLTVFGLSECAKPERFMLPQTDIVVVLLPRTEARPGSISTFAKQAFKALSLTATIMVAACVMLIAAAGFAFDSRAIGFIAASMAITVFAFAVAYLLRRQIAARLARIRKDGKWRKRRRRLNGLIMRGITWSNSAAARWTVQTGIVLGGALLVGFPSFVWLGWSRLLTSLHITLIVLLVAITFGIVALLLIRGAVSLRVARSLRSILPHTENDARQSGTEPLAVVLHLESYARIADALGAAVLDAADFDAIHIHDHVCMLAAGTLKKRLDIPIVWDAHEIYRDLAAIDVSRARANHLIVVNQQHHVDAFITINESIANFYVQQYPHLAEPTVVMNATIPTRLLAYDGRLHDAAGLPRSQRILLFQGGFGHCRGLRALVGAAENLPASWTLVLMGWGGLENELRAIARGQTALAGLPRTVFLPGVPYHELQAWSSGASLGAILYENTSLNHLYCTPNKLWEYPNAGVPILATDLVEIGKVVRQHEIGFLVERDFDAHDIIRAVVALSDQDLANTRQNCLDFAEVQNWSLYEPRLRAVYEKMRDAVVA